VICTEDKFLQVDVVQEDGNDFEEHVGDVTDSVIQEFLRIIPKQVLLSPDDREKQLLLSKLQKLFDRVFRDPQIDDSCQDVFIPTALQQFLQVICRQFPHHFLLLADFDHLPDTIPGINAPAVCFLPS
jgi:hypothetical protein